MKKTNIRCFPEHLLRRHHLKIACVWHTVDAAFHSAAIKADFLTTTNTYTITVTRKASSSSSSGGNSETTYYIITATAGTGGSISPSGSASVISGADKTYTITADEGYEIEDVLVDGESVGAVSAYTFENIKKVHTITASFKETESENTEEGVINLFADVDADDWFYDSVMYVYENGLMNGNGGHFNPDEDMTRAMAVTVLFRLSGDTGSYENTFSDVASGEWYEQVAAWAAAASRPKARCPANSLP